MKRLLILFLCFLVLICGIMLGACKKKAKQDGNVEIETSSEEPYSEMDFEEEIIIPIEEYEGVDGL